MSEVAKEAAQEETKEKISAEERALLQAELHNKIVAKYNNMGDTKEYKFAFKSDKQTGFKRPTVELRLPVMSVDGLVDLLNNADTRPKELELLMDVLADAVYDQARPIVNDNESINQDNFPLDKVTWAFIANMPKAERRGGGIAKETWEEFAKDYMAVMPAATGKTMDQVGAAAKLLVPKFAQVKTQKPVINLLIQQLGIYVNVTQQLEEFTECVEFLNKKAETLLNMSDEDLLANL